MKKHFDKLGRVVIPRIFREELNFEENDIVDIKLNNYEIILSNPKYKDKQEIISFLMERENKLQIIEFILKNIETVTVNDIKRILNIKNEK